MEQHESFEVALSIDLSVYTSGARICKFLLSSIQIVVVCSCEVQPGWDITKGILFPSKTTAGPTQYDTVHVPHFTEGLNLASKFQLGLPSSRWGLSSRVQLDSLGRAEWTGPPKLQIGQRWAQRLSSILSR